MTEQSLPEESIFLRALDIPSAGERNEYLDQACGENANLRAEVEALLRAHEKSGDLLDLPESPDPTIDQPITEKPGSQIGPFKLLQPIGEGGMGVVYMAEQIEPVERRVALKIIKPGMDTRQVIARFEAERQALAMMDHPNIAQVLDAGTTNSGRPFFAMELVRGIPITQYCDEHQFTVRQRLELFADVCHAVQHAHQKGIIHRDIKPSNVLVAEYDDRAVPKIIDFGLAKAIQQRLTEKTMFTHMGQVVGTLEYMSPEQAKLTQLDIDTRSDIYSLGVLLYELLTGETPFDRKRLRSAAFDEILRILREEEPPRPSLKVSTSDSLPSIAANRHVEPRQLSALVHGELDWIVMKAMDKDRSRRYDTANAFASDVANYLKDETVQACPPSTAYRFRKLVRRNRVLLTTTAMVALALIVGTGISLWQALEAHRARDLADRRLTAETAARKDADANLVLANEATAREQAEREKAEENYRLAREAVDKYFVKVSQNTLLNKPGMRPLRMELLELALAYYQDFAEQDSGDPELQAELGKTYVRIGEILHDLGRHDDSLAAFDQALAIQRKLAKSESNENVEHRIYLIATLSGIAGANSYRGDHDRAIESLEEGESILNSVAGLLTPGQRVVEARLLNQRGIVLRNIGDRREEATDAFRRGLEIVEEVLEKHPDMPEEDRKKYSTFPAVFTNNLAIYEPDDQEAIRLFTRSIQLEERLLAESNSEGVRHRMAIHLQNRASRFRNLGDFENALKSTQLAIQHLESLSSDNPGVIDYQDQLRELYPFLRKLRGEKSYGLGRTGYSHLIARDVIPRAQAFFDTVLDEHSALRDDRLRTAWALVKVGHEQWLEDRTDEALSNIELAEETLDAINVPDLDQQNFILLQHCLGMTSYVRGRIAISLKPSGAPEDELIRDAIRAFTRGIRVGSLDQDRQASIYPIRAHCYHLLGEIELAISDLESAIRLDPENPLNRKILDHVYRGALLHEKRLPHITELIGLADEAEKGGLYQKRGLILVKLGRYDEALEDLERAVDLGAGGRFLYSALITAHFRLGDHEKVLELFDQSLEPLSWDGRYAAMIAGIYMQLRADEQALALLDKAMERGASPPGLSGLMKAYLRLGNEQMAQVAFDKLVERTQRDVTYYRMLGGAHFARGEYEQAISALDRAVEIAPPESRYVPLNARSNCLRLMGRFEEALKDAQEAVELRYDGRNSPALGRALVGVGRFEEALTEFNQLMAGRHAPHFGLSRGQALEGLERFDEALADYSLDNNQEFATRGVRMRRALLHERLGNYRQALADYETVDASTRVAPFRYAQAYQALVQFIWFLLNCPETELRDPPRALELAQRFAQAYPENAEFQNAIAACHYRLGKDSDALNHLRQAEQLESGGADPFLKAMVYWRSGKEDEAKKAYAAGQTRASETGQTQRFQTEAEKLFSSNADNDAESTHKPEETAK